MYFANVDNLCLNLETPLRLAALQLASGSATVTGTPSQAGSLALPVALALALALSSVPWHWQCRGGRGALAGPPPPCGPQAASGAGVLETRSCTATTHTAARQYY